MRARGLALASVALCVGCWCAPAWGQGEELRQAYQREYALVEAERRALEERLVEARRDSGQRVQQAKQKVEGLQGRLQQVRREADALEEELQAQEAQGGQGEGEDVLGAWWERAASSLGQEGVKVSGPSVDAQGRATPTQGELRGVFEAGVAGMRRDAQVRVEEGSFFLLDGSKVEGRLVRVGGVATYGLWGQGAGALSPAGQGRLQVWPQDTAGSARAVEAGQRQGTLQVFLHESLEQGVAPPKTQTWREFLNSGGDIAWVIVGVGLVAALLALGRALGLLVFWARSRGVMKEALGLVSRGEVSEALALCRKRGGPGGRVLEGALVSLGQDNAEQDRAISERMLREVPTLERFASLLGVLAAVAPLLGLLGTVTGMIATFDILTEHGNSNPRLLSGGISEALITTELGLVVAIPTLLVGALLSSWSDNLAARLEQGTLRVLNASAARRAEGEASSP